MLSEKRVADRLKFLHHTLSVAESCTGGLLSHRLTGIAGSSDYFIGGVVAYSNDVKTRLLDVPAAALKKHGAVSPQTAVRMAEGVRRLFNTDYGIGITGIAGPGGGTPAKPVGLVHIAVALRGKDTRPLIRKYLFKGTRSRVKMQAANAALTLLLKNIGGL